MRVPPKLLNWEAVWLGQICAALPYNAASWSPRIPREYEIIEKQSIERLFKLAGVCNSSIDAIVEATVGTSTDRSKSFGDCERLFQLNDTILDTITPGLKAFGGNYLEYFWIGYFLRELATFCRFNTHLQIARDGVPKGDGGSDLAEQRTFLDSMCTYVEEKTRKLGASRQLHSAIGIAKGMTITGSSNAITSFGAHYLWRSALERFYQEVAVLADGFELCTKPQLGREILHTDKFDEVVNRLSFPLRGLNIFLSYTREDETVVTKILRVLTAESGQCWLDSASLSGGSNLRTALHTAIGESDVFMALVGKKYAASEWTRLEVEHAIERKANHKGLFVLLPVRLPGTSESDIPKELQHLSWVDLERNFREGMLQIVFDILRVRLDGLAPWGLTFDSWSAPK